MEGPKQERFGLERYPVQDGAWVDAYWRDDQFGRGPAASLYVNDAEVLRLDCFAGSEGHLHVNWDGRLAERWYFPEGTVREHIARAAFELATNAQLCLRMNRDPAIHATRLDRSRLKAAAEQMRITLLRFADELGV